MTELKPCPVCGTTDYTIKERVRKNPDDVYELCDYIFRHTCLKDNYVSTCSAKTKEELIENWNRGKVTIRTKQLLMSKDEIIGYY